MRTIVLMESVHTSERSIACVAQKNFLVANTAPPTFAGKDKERTLILIDYSASNAVLVL